MKRVKETTKKMYHISSYTPEMGWMCEYYGDSKQMADNAYTRAIGIYGQGNVSKETTLSKEVSEIICSMKKEPSGEDIGLSLKYGKYANRIENAVKKIENEIMQLRAENEILRGYVMKLQQ